MEKTTAQTASKPGIEELKFMADRLRRHSLVTTAEAASGHPTTCMSSADLVATLFFRYLRFDLENPRDRRNDRFVLSKGHGAPLLWAALAEGGAFPIEHLMTLREIDSDLEGHPTPRNKWIDVATGSLGQGLSVGVGMAISSKMDQTSSRVYVLMGDGEMAEGSVWEAASLAGHLGLGNLTAIVDVNGLGQSERTMFGHNLDVYDERLRAFGWDTRMFDGHDFEQVIAAYEWALGREGKPTALIARTEKGAGVSFVADEDGWHGKPLMGEDLKAALTQLEDVGETPSGIRIQPPDSSGGVPQATTGAIEGPAYSSQDSVATRVAYGTGLAKLGAANSEVVALDGDTKNSTYSQTFMKRFPERFVECYIAEQNMVGAATGFAALGKTPFCSTFAAFLTRAYDQIRMASVSQANLKVCGSHAGVSIGEDGPSQMGLEDLAMMRAVSGSTVLYPSDAVCAERAVALAAETPGIVYIRTSRPKTPILYSNDEEFHVGGSKVVRRGENDRATVVAAGITLHQALKACDELKSRGIDVRVIDLYSIKPVDTQALTAAADDTGLVVTVEDHYPAGGLGDAVFEVLANHGCRLERMAVRGLPRSGKSEQLLEAHGISSQAIVETVLQALG